MSTQVAGALRRWLSAPVIAMSCGVLLIAGFIALGQWARDDIRHANRYRLDFGAIDCEVPPGMTRATFLSEVQYLANWAGPVEALDDDIAPRLTAAFSRHPWVEHVDGVDHRAPANIRVRLTFRHPVLAVRTEHGLRAVDRHAILLPDSAPTEHLPLFTGNASKPSGPAGTPWGDSAVAQAARAMR